MNTPPPGRDPSCLYTNDDAGGRAATPVVGFKAGGVVVGAGASVASYRRDIISAVYDYACRTPDSMSAWIRGGEYIPR